MLEFSLNPVRNTPQYRNSLPMLSTQNSAEQTLNHTVHEVVLKYNDDNPNCKLSLDIPKWYVICVITSFYNLIVSEL
jgi:hypothetical protein